LGIGRCAEPIVEHSVRQKESHKAIGTSAFTVNDEPSRAGARPGGRSHFLAQQEDRNG
jgi:hypothetical protein